MCARRVATHVREIEILCDQKALRRLRGVPHFRIGATDELLCANGVDVVTKSG